MPNVGDGLIIEGNGSTLERDPNSTKNFGLVRVLTHELTIRNLTLQNGDATNESSGRANGAAVLYTGRDEVVFENVRFLNNRARDGGAFYGSFNSRPVFRGCLFRENVATRNGGAIAQPRLTGPQFASGALVVNCVFEGNRAASGGALWIERNGVQIAESTFTENIAQLGGAMTFEFSHSLDLANSAVYGNTATQSQYGGIYSADAGDLRILNSTISNNFGLEEQRGFQLGKFGRGAMWVEFSTILNASYPDATFDRAIDFRGSFYRFYNSIIGGCNVSVTDPDDVVSLGNWYLFDNCNGSANGEPQLGPLRDNGGRTLTYAPLDGSPLIDAASPTGFDGVLAGPDLDEYTSRIDQRRSARPETESDIGSVERQAPAGFSALSLTQRNAVIMLMLRQSGADDES
ncbi:MAG: choice-of-anchor Q domain-containing protein [Pseudomonadota bacterium]